MAKKNKPSSELEAMKMEAMRIRFRKVLGETVAPHIIKKTRKDIAKCVKSLNSSGEKDA